MTADKKREFKSMQEYYGIGLSALCGDYGKGFTDRESNAVYVEKSKRILDLAKELGTDIVTTHIGVVPDDTGCETYQVMQQACAELAAYADSLDAHFAVETGPESGLSLKTFLDSLHSTGVAVNLDPANLIMSGKDGPVQAVEALKNYIVHTHAKDGIRFETVTDAAMLERIRPYQDAGRVSLEVALGKGQVEFVSYLKKLEAVGYRGCLTIEREVGDNPEADIAMAVSYLKDIMKNN
jgi:sugar phosphate isomerase/epimerase